MDVKMKYTKKLNEMLLSDDNSYELKFYTLKSLFKIAEFWSFSEENKELILQKKDFDGVDIYLDYIEYYTSKYLTKWKNLNTLEDFMYLKELLKEMYFNSAVDNALKSKIVNALGSFPTMDDYDFYNQILDDVFSYKDEEVCMDILVNSYLILEFIENNYFNIKIIQSNPDRMAKIFHGTRCISNGNLGYMTSLKAIQYIRNRNRNLKFLESYNINQQIETLMDDNAKSILNYKILENNENIGIHFKINDNSIFEIPQVNIVGLLNDFCILLDAYFNKNKNLALAQNKFQIKEVKFDTKWKKKYDRYLTKITENKDSSMHIEIDTRDLLFTFSKMFAHLTFVYELKYSICLQNKTDISKKDYIKLITLFERAI